MLCVASLDVYCTTKLRWGGVFYSIGRLCDKVEACEARIEISVLRSESTDLKLGKIIGLMESLSGDILSL